MKKYFCAGALFLAAIFTIHVMPAAQPAPQTLKALIVTGQNNHNWQVSHPILQEQLRQSGLFDVSLLITREQGGAQCLFTDFDLYDVVILDYNGDRWSKKTDKAFLKYVRKGGGVVFYHAADNAFADWPEFNRMSALGGWENRNEKSGPYVYWKDGALYKGLRNARPRGLSRRTA